MDLQKATQDIIKIVSYNYRRHFKQMVIMSAAAERPVRNKVLITNI